MSRALTLRNLLDKKHKTLPFQGIMSDILGQPESRGVWLIYGAEKNGKTWFALLLAQELSAFGQVMYISAEEGTGLAFVASTQRAKLDPQNRNLLFYEYMPLTEITDKLSKRRSPSIIIFDNTTIYNDELKNGGLRNLTIKFPDKLFLFLAHEERGEPYTSTAKLARKLASVIFRVQGLAAFVSGRVPGGVISIDETKAKIFHSNNI